MDALAGLRTHKEPPRSVASPLSRSTLRPAMTSLNLQTSKRKRSRRRKREDAVLRWPRR